MNKVRLIKQTDRFRCAPIAILNAYKLLGLNKTKKDLPSLSKQLKTKHKSGTSNYKLMCYIYDNFVVRDINSKNLRKIDKALESGKFLFFTYFCSERNKGHIGLIIKKKKHYYECSNFSKRQPRHIIHKSTLKKYIESDFNIDIYQVLGTK